MTIFKNFWNWLTLSSVNPEKTSLTVKMFLLGLIPVSMKVVLFACTFGVVCLSTSTDQLTTVVNTVADIVFYALSLWASVGLVFGWLRKVSTTVSGTNQVINQ